jgi:hypothetical protein
MAADAHGFFARGFAAAKTFARRAWMWHYIAIVKTIFTNL